MGGFEPWYCCTCRRFRQTIRGEEREEKEELEREERERVEREMLLSQWEVKKKKKGVLIGHFEFFKKKNWGKNPQNTLKKPGENPEIALKIICFYTSCFQL